MESNRIRVAGKGDIMHDRLASFAEFTTQHLDVSRFFIVGFGKSGTTWLYRICNTHPQVTSVAERRLFESPRGSHALLSSILDDALFMSWFQSSSFGKRTPCETSSRFEIARILSDYLLFRALETRPGDSKQRSGRQWTHIGEKIALNNRPDAELTIRSLAHMYPDAKVIHIVRDPRDAAVSRLFHSYRGLVQENRKSWVREYVETGNFGELANFISRARLRHFLSQTAIAWQEVVETFRTEGNARFGLNFAVVRYESLLENTAGEIRRLFDFLDLRISEKIIDRAVEKTSFQTLTKGRSRGQADVNSFYRKGVAGDWKEHFTVRTNSVVVKKVGDLMSELGYQG